MGDSLQALLAKAAGRKTPTKCQPSKGQLTSLPANKHTSVYKAVLTRLRTNKTLKTQLKLAAGDKLEISFLYVTNGKVATISNVVIKNKTKCTQQTLSDSNLTADLQKDVGILRVGGKRSAMVTLGFTQTIGANDLKLVRPKAGSPGIVTATAFKIKNPPLTDKSMPKPARDFIEIALKGFKHSLLSQGFSFKLKVSIIKKEESRIVSGAIQKNTKFRIRIAVSVRGPRRLQKSEIQAFGNAVKAKILKAKLRGLLDPGKYKITLRFKKGTKSAQIAMLMSR